MEIYFVTGNKNKFEEIKSIIPELIQLDLEVPEIQELDAKEVIKFKLTEAVKIHQGRFIVEDTSLYLDCLKGLPGPLIKWFMKTFGGRGLYEIAYKMGNNKAEAKTIIGYSTGAGEVHFFEGVVEGEMVEPRGVLGWGWDPIFKPLGYTKTFAEMTPEEKTQVSMRKFAADKFKAFLNDH